MRAFSQTKRLSKTLFFNAFTSSSSSSLRTLTTLQRSSSYVLSNLLSSPDSHGTTIANVDADPWSAIQYRGIKVNAIHVRPGNVIENSGRLYQVLEAGHKQQGRGGAKMQLELRDIDSGSKQSLRFSPDEDVEKVVVVEKTYTCLYTESGTAHLMDPEEFEQLEVSTDLFGRSAIYLKEEMEVKLQLCNGRPFSGSVPKKVTCSIKEAHSQMKGVTGAARYKKAVLDIGLTVEVPAYLEAGEKVIISTDHDSFVSRA